MVAMCLERETVQLSPFIDGYFIYYGSQSFSIIDLSEVDRQGGGTGLEKEGHPSEAKSDSLQKHRQPERTCFLGFKVLVTSPVSIS